MDTHAAYTWLLREIATLNGQYYRNVDPNREERMAYYGRLDGLEKMRESFYECDRHYQNCPPVV
jgi:hypothetical protein